MWDHLQAWLCSWVLSLVCNHVFITHISGRSPHNQGLLRLCRLREGAGTRTGGARMKMFAFHATILCMMEAVVTASQTSAFAVQVAAGLHANT